MSVLLETSKGDITIDLHTDLCPIACKNFLKLCKVKYYNFCLFHNVQPGSLIQTGDPTGTGKGGESVYRMLHGEQARYFEDELHRSLRHARAGTVSMASSGPNTNGSQFFITVADEQEHLDDKYTVFGEVAEGMEVARAIAAAYADGDGRPYQNIRIRHTIVLDDPFDDPPGLEVPVRSPEPSALVLQQDRERLAENEGLEEEDARPADEVAEALAAKEAKSRAEVLEMLGDLPDADMAPPENVLFVCKLNPVTDDDDLSIIFERFGEVVSCEVIRDFKTGDSLNYAFVEFKEVEAALQAKAEHACEAYFKMDGALVDDRRIHVDFSQSVSGLWNKRRRKEQMPAFGGKDANGGHGGGGGRGGGGGGRGGGGSGVRQGDWSCLHCGANVFASKDACFRCHTPKGVKPPPPPKALAPPTARREERGGHDRGRDRDRKRDQERGRDRERDQEQGRDRERDQERGRDRERDRDRDRGRDRDDGRKKSDKHERDGRNRDSHRDRDKDRRRDRDERGQDDRDRSRERERDHNRRERDRDRREN